MSPPSARPATRTRRVAPLHLLGCIALVAVLILGTAGLLLAHLRDRAFEDAGRELRNVATILADQAERAFESVELVQLGILERLSREGVGSPEEFRAAMTGRAMHDELRSRIRGLPQIDAVTAIDDGGNLLNFTRYWPIPRVNVSDRDYFQALRDTPGLDSFISKPVPNRGTGTATIYIARKVATPEGRFVGLILGAVELAYFERLYASAVPGQHGSIALFRTDSTLLARYPRAEVSVGRPFAGIENFQSLQAAGARGRVIELTSPIDGERRLAVGRGLTRYPLVVSATVTVRSVLDDWRKQVALVGTVSALLVAIAVAASILLTRHLRSQRQLAEAEAALALAAERERAQRQAREQDARFAAALANMSLGVVMFDRDGRLLVANPGYVAMYGLPPALAAVGTPAEEVQRHLASLVAGADGLQTSQPAGGDAVEDVCSLRDGRVIKVSSRMVAEGGWVATHEDVTERRAAQARIAHMAHHDALTGLPNRVLLRERLRAALARERRGEPCAVLCLDLDRFKDVNDTLGHPAGDALLRAVTQRLREACRETDTIARLGGDEFAIIQSAADLPTDALTLARRLVAAIAAPFEIEGHQISIGTSIGIALAPQDGRDPDTLLKAADLALYCVKERGRGAWRFFEPEMDARMQARRSLEMDLRRAVAMEQFELHYQPLVDMPSGTVSGFEALVRWQHPERGMVPPDQFIPLAEETGLIVPLGAWVLQRACADAMTWPAPLKVAVNLSPSQVCGGGPVRAVAAALAGSGLPPGRLELEITETAMLEDSEATMAVLRELKALGVSIALDDFGTGYSSLSYLRRFPFDRVKIDRSFIRGLGDNSQSAAIVQAVTGLCAALGMAATAEGVETETQLAALGVASNLQLQGYLFSPPRPAAEVPRLCAELGLGARQGAASA